MSFEGRGSLKIPLSDESTNTQRKSIISSGYSMARSAASSAGSAMSKYSNAKKKAKADTEKLEVDMQVLKQEHADRQQAQVARENTARARNNVLTLQKQAGKQAKRHSQSFDADGSGQLNVHEFVKMMRTFERYTLVDDAELRQHFNDLDVDNSGHLDSDGLAVFFLDGLY